MNFLDTALTGRKNFLDDWTKCSLSLDNPPPITIQWRWGWNWRFWPQVCNTDVNPGCAPRFFLLAHISRIVSLAALNKMPYRIFWLENTNGFNSLGRVKTTWKYCTGKVLLSCFSIHLACWAPWQTGQWRFPQEWKWGTVSPQSLHCSMKPPISGVRQEQIDSSVFCLWKGRGILERIWSFIAVKISCMLLINESPSNSVQRTLNSLKMFSSEMNIAAGSCNIRMTKKFLNRTKVRAIFKKMRGKRMTKTMCRYLFSHFDFI